MSMRRALALLLAVTMLTVGCVGTFDGPATETQTADQAQTSGITEVQDRHEMAFNTSMEGPSDTLDEPVYDVLGGLGVYVNADLPATEGGGAPTDSADVHMGLFLPDIPGCNWAEYGFNPDGGEVEVTAPEEGLGQDAEVPEKCQVPVVADIGPYYSTREDRRNVPFAVEGDNHATEPATRLGGFLIEELVPQGYAVAQVSVFGTGDSGHCMDLMGDSEQAGIDAAVEFLGEAAFSNGNVGLTGRSYDGTTPWEAASTEAANDHLKTIAPISGLIGLKDLMWRNGSAEARGGSGLLWGIYYAFGPDGTAEDAEHVTCPDATIQGMPQHLAAYATGGDMGPAEQTYFAERDGFLAGALENYNGSVYLIQGLQDWNVDPHQAFPAFEKLQEEGIETKGLFGQWDHAYPDRQSNHEDQDSGYGEEAFPATVRHDWAQDLLEWFDHYLKEDGEKPQLHAEVQDNRGFWRLEESYPPEDTNATELTLDEAELTEGDAMINDPASECATFTFSSPSEEQATRIVGMPTFHPEVTPMGAGGQLFAQLNDAETGLRLGHAVMDLRYHEGGDERQELAPGQPITAEMQFQAMDVVLPGGHDLELEVCPTGMDYMPPATDNPVELSLTEDSVLTLTVDDPADDEFLLPPGQAEVLADGTPPDADGDPSTSFGPAE
jgi:predicted acyl esterase